MSLSLSEKTIVINPGFSVFDQLSYSDSTLAFGDIISAETVRELFSVEDSLFGCGEEDLWSTGLTLWSFIGQVLQDGKQRSCNAAVTNATRYMLEQGLTPPSFDSGEYCRARGKLNIEVMRQLVTEICRKMTQASPESWLWHNKDVKLVDGFTFTMPDTPENQSEFPQMAAQKPGVGFPIARACAILSCTDGCISDIAIGPYKGKETGESALLRQLLHNFQPEDIMLADRFFCSYWMLAILKMRGVDGCMRLHQLRKVDESKVKWLGDNEYIDTWYKPQKATWISQELYDNMPEKLDIRICCFDSKSKSKSELLEVATTLTDPEQYPATDIGQLYNYRWSVELDINSIKTSLNLDYVRCKTPDMVRREMWTTLLAYNMVRLVCAQAAYAHNKHPRQMSFTIACNNLLNQWLMPPSEEIRETLGRYNLLQIARNEVGNRPGRIEPRVVKQRPRSFTFMTKPRAHYKISTTAE